MKTRIKKKTEIWRDALVGEEFMLGDLKITVDELGRAAVCSYCLTCQRVLHNKLHLELHRSIVLDGLSTNTRLLIGGPAYHIICFQTDRGSYEI